jgi:hypothetical protein
MLFNKSNKIRENTFIGVVYITRCLFFSDFAMAYSATTVFPAKIIFNKKFRVKAIQIIH